ncbi:MAG: gluconokinase [Paracoccus sp. (in: a-proteobacteria)]|uniref:gluconokinase n=1 Tax=Paracoccus sp. TaxID=267 RepID=UPI003919C31A
MTEIGRVVVMGVSGCGKTAVGRALAQHLGRRFVDADSLHSPENIAKMAAGQPLDDDDRAGWLEALAGLIAREDGLVLACSALKRRYRDRLRQADPALTFLYLHGSFQTISTRMRSRDDHYFAGEHMLESQFSQLEEPVDEPVLNVSVEQDLDKVIAASLAALGAAPAR